MPLLVTSGAQINAQLPFAVSVSTNQQVLVQWGQTYAARGSVDVAAASPGTFQYGQSLGIAADAKGP